MIAWLVQRRRNITDDIPWQTTDAGSPLKEAADPRIARDRWDSVRLEAHRRMYHAARLTPP
jgi:hypothetical protein